MEDESTGSFREEGRDPVHHVEGTLMLNKHCPESNGIDIVEARLYVKQEGGDFPAGSLKGAYFMDEGGDGIHRAESRE